VAYIMINAMTLMGRPEAMVGLWQQGQSIAGTDAVGATYGLGINSSEPTLWYRYGAMFGLAMTTVSFWTVFDAMILIPKRKEKSPEELQNDDDYRRWAGSFALIIAWIGGAIAVVCFFLYRCCIHDMMFTIMSDKGRHPIFVAYPFWISVATLTPFLGAVAITCAKLFRTGRFVTAIGISLCQLLALTTFAIARQCVQNLEIPEVHDFAENTQLEPIYTSPLVVFLVVFTIGALVVTWMIRQMAIAPAPTE